MKVNLFCILKHTNTLEKEMLKYEITSMQCVIYAMSSKILNNTHGYRHAIGYINGTTWN